MDSKHEVISTFLDDEPFDLRHLADALGEPAGRALLIDLISLRRIVQPVDALPAIAAPTSVKVGQWRLVAAAALVIGLTGGYLIAARRSVPTAVEAPSPTRVVQAVPFVPAGGGR
jgi:hypothetical protein